MATARHVNPKKYQLVDIPKFTDLWMPVKIVIKATASQSTSKAREGDLGLFIKVVRVRKRLNEFSIKSHKVKSL